MKKSILITIMILAVVWSTGSAVQAGIIGPDLNVVLQSLGPDEEVAVIVSLADKVDPGQFTEPNKGLRRAALVRALKGKANATQGPLNAFLRGKGAGRLKQLWIINGIAATVKAGDIAELAGRPEVEKISLDGKISAPEPTPASAAAAEWNLDAIGTPALWAMGYTGAGVVVASMDTGVDADHPDLATRYRGGANSWYDPNGEHTTTPFDSDGHGTQVMSVMVGGDAGGTSIGVAPGAQWIAVKMYNDAGSATYSNMHLGFQWLMDPDGDPGTDDAADVVNNSWGFRQIVGECFTEFQPDIQALKAAQIAVVFSAGNGGPYAYTSESPANNPGSFASGAVDDTGTVAYFSGRGPSACDAGIYPEVAAPGVNIRTAYLTYGGTNPDPYADATGTSVAAPHVAGAMAMLLSAHPEATVDQLEQALTDTALDLGAAGPDNDYGYGLIDLVAAEGWLANPPGPVCTAEIKHDGIDQDCNGYDLTIDIIKADYTAKRDMLSVEATSDLGQDANLELVGYGAMKWNRKNSKWTISVRGAGGDPGTVTVSGIEGSETAPTN